jgi:hypothetical protein
MLGVSAMQGIEDHLVSCKNVHLVRILSMAMVMKQVVIALVVVYVITPLAHAPVSLDILEIDVTIKPPCGNMHYWMVQ